MSETFLASEAARVAGLWILNLGGLGLADLWARRVKMGGEGARKVIHMVGGTLALPLPWVLRSNVSMLVLAIGGFAGLVACRRLGLLRSVHGVRRHSFGDLLFPLGVALLFFVGRDRPAFYLIGLSFMVVSDALAAVVGRRYGSAQYEVERGRRSLEGSIAFFFASFLAAHLILLLATDASRVSSVLVAAQLALLATCFEAISLGGNDNVLVPLVTCLLVVRLIDVPPPLLARDLAIQLSIGGMVGGAAWHWRFAGVSGAVTLALFLYGAWALGGPLWAAASVLVIGGYLLIRSLHWGGEHPAERHHQVVALFYVSVVAATLFILGASLQVADFRGVGATVHAALLSPYLGAAAGQLSILMYTVWRPWDASAETLDPGILPAIVSAAVFAPFAFCVSSEATTPLLWIIAGPFIALTLYRRGRDGTRWPRPVPWNYRLQAAAVACALALVTPVEIWIF